MIFRQFLDPLANPPPHLRKKNNCWTIRAFFNLFPFLSLHWARFISFDLKHNFWYFSIIAFAIFANIYLCSESSSAAQRYAYLVSSFAEWFSRISNIFIHSAPSFMFSSLSNSKGDLSLQCVYCVLDYDHPFMTLRLSNCHVASPPRWTPSSPSSLYCPRQVSRPFPFFHLCIM